jgi:aspartyl-tRNA(Asn)/glutamyl-tRNA(Gln) amidotransferase subunit B
MNTAAKSKNLINGATGEWEVVIGMEVHAQVSSNAKLFSGASTEFGGAPNSHVSLVDAAMPGMLPVINAECVRQAVRSGLGLNARINLKSVFDRKNYFYPDLPQGYQISQYKSPIVGEGEVVVDLEGESFTVGIERLHLEQDAGKSLHDQHPGLSYVDLNRSGVALMEIVSKPDIRSSEQAKAYVAKLRSILRYLGTCDGDMEKGSLRADVNVSVRKPGAPLGTRCEIKNVNSIRFIGQAIEHEARRQIEVLEGGGSIVQETRLYDPDRDETRSMRTKEDAHDYRYFPDPDLPPLAVSEQWIAAIRAGMPELPEARRGRYRAELGLSAYDALTLTQSRELADYFERAHRASAGAGVPAKTVANWVMGGLSAKLNEAGADASRSAVDPERLAVLLARVQDGTISGKTAKDVFDAMWSGEGDPDAIIERRGLRQISDAGALEAIVAAVLAANAKQVEDYRAGKEKAFNALVGQVMKQTQGKANPAHVNALLRKKLAG